MRLFNWINPIWVIDNFLTTQFDPITATAAATVAAEAAAPTAAMVAPSILAGTGSALTGAGMMTAGADLVAPSLLTAGSSGLLGGVGTGLGAMSGANSLLNLNNEANIPMSAYTTTPMGIELTSAPTNQTLGNGLSYEINPYTVAMGGSDSAMQQYSPSLMDKLAATGSNTFDWMKANPMATLGAGKMFADFKNPPKPPMVHAPSAGINRGSASNYQPINVGEIPQLKYPHSLLLGY